MASNRGSWTGCFANKRPAAAQVSLTAPIQPSTSGGSGSFLGVASDGQRYWLKTLNNFQGPKVPVTEQIVARVGLLFGAPVCGVKTVEIPEELTGWEFRTGSGRKLERGIAHGSLAVVDAIETRQLEKRDQNQNATRHVALLALHDLCWGSDVQWLTCTSREHEYHAHDHGYFLPPEGPDWNTGAMSDAIDKPHEYPDSGAGLDKAAVANVADKLCGLTQDALVQALSMVPSAWPASNAELAEVGYFLLHRGSQVAARMRTRWLGG